MNTSNFALITGASSGIGFEMSKYIAQKGHNLILISRNKNKLLEMKRNLEKIYDIECIVIISDLTKEGSISKFMKKLKKEHIRVDIGILNAGFGNFEKFEDSLITNQLNMIDLNISSLVELSYELIPFLEKQKSHMLFVASTAAFQPIPKMATYAATKSFVLSFSQALREELNEKINVSTLCPGPTKTNFENRANMSNISFFKSSSVMNAKDVAKIGIDKMFDNKAIIIPGTQNSIGASFGKLIPTSLSTKIISKIMRD